MLERLPVKLGKEPLIDSGCELVVNATVDLHTVFPGILFTKLEGVTDLEQVFGVMNAPGETDGQPVMNTAGRAVRLQWNGYLVIVGARNVVVAPRLPYKGWADYRLKAAEVFELLLGSSFVTGVVRYSIKFVNLLEAQDPSKQHSMLRWSLDVGGRPVGEKPTQLRTEFMDGGFLTIYQLSTGVAAEVFHLKGTLTGTLVDVDTLRSLSSSEAPEFRKNLAVRLDEIRHRNKASFFGVLTAETIASLEPVYE